MASMHFRTELNTAKSRFEISHNSTIMNFGSCFADNMSYLFHQNKFKCHSNSFGILYNPISIFNSIDTLFQFEAENFVQRDDTWYSFDCHSELNAHSPKELSEKIISIQSLQTEFIKKTDALIITLGTAFVFENSNQKIVANCHKISSKSFKKRLLEIDEIIVAFENLHLQLVQINPICKFIFTVSPVRHIKDTIELNNVSKSILRLAIHNITEKHSNCQYFPAFEIMVDDLRDYRFYENDMLHPNKTAIAYIWGKFSETYFSSETQNIVLKWQKTLASINHRSFNPNSESHQYFLSQLLKDLATFETNFDVSKEIELIKSQLIQ